MIIDRELIQTPPQGTINIFRDSDGGVYFKDDTGKVHVTLSYHDVFKIENPKFRYYKVASQDEKISILRSSEKEFIFALYRGSTMAVGGRSGGGGIRGITIQDEDVQVNGVVNTLNFEGASVTVTDDGGGKVTITVGGGSMITGGGTLNRLAMFTPNGSTIGDSPLLRSGSDVIADGFVYFNSGFGIDVVASGGSDVLNIGTSNADVINYGYAGTTHNMNGTVFNVQTTNLNVADKIITLNDGGAAGSGGNSGFEIEEGGVATGYFIQNSTRNGFNFQASAITGVATFDLSLLTANRTAILQNASGTLAYLSDIPVNAFVQNGNSFGANAVLGTNDAFSLSFETSGTTWGTISTTGLWGINASPIAGTQFYIKGIGTTTANKILRLDNGTPTETFSVYSSAQIFAGEATFFNLFMGIDSGLLVSGVGGGVQNTAVGYQAMMSVTTGNTNSAFGYRALRANTTGLGNSAFGNNSLLTNISGQFNAAFGELTLSVNTASFNTAIGYAVLQANTSGQGNVGVGYTVLDANTTGGENTAVGDGAMTSNTTGTNSSAFGSGALSNQTTGGGVTGYNSAFGVNSLQDLTTGSENDAFGEFSLSNVTTGTQNTGFGGYAGLGVTTGARNIFIGYFSGFGAGNVSDQLWIDNANNTNPLIFGDLANRNLGLNVKTFGTSANSVFAIPNGTEPTTSPANQIQLFSVDTTDATASLGLRTEQAVEIIGATVLANKLKVRINGVQYFLLLG